MPSLALAPTPSPAAVFHALRGEPDRVWIDEGARGFFCWGASEVIRGGQGAFDRARGAMRSGSAHPLGFRSGLVGWLGYEAGRWCERMPEPRGPRRLDDLRLARFEGALHYVGDRWIAIGEAPYLRAADALVGSAVEPDPCPPTGRLVDVGDPGGFLQGVVAVLEHIARGDCYQVNLARRLVVEGIEDADAAYLRLRRRSPACHGAFLAADGASILSNSPELFLRLRGDRIESRPIKGTRELGRALELAEDPKERAELTMIVDLVRNDLGRVCVPGSVRADPRRLRELPTLLHAEQAVHGQLRGDAYDAVGAAFPPGSVTGAPKVQAMEVIRALEPVPRGVYTGAIGWFDDCGDAELSVAIRTATVVDGVADLHVGCGLVADSEPARELAESQLKAKALLDAFLQPIERATAATSEAPRTAEITAQA